MMEAKKENRGRAISHAKPTLVWCPVGTDPTRRNWRDRRVRGREVKPIVYVGCKRERTWVKPIIQIYIVAVTASRVSRNSRPRVVVADPKTIQGEAVKVFPVLNLLMSNTGNALVLAHNNLPTAQKGRRSPHSYPRVGHCRVVDRAATHDEPREAENKNNRRPRSENSTAAIFSIFFHFFLFSAGMTCLA